MDAVTIATWSQVTDGYASPRASIEDMWGDWHEPHELDTLHAAYLAQIRAALPAALELTEAGDVVTSDPEAQGSAEMYREIAAAAVRVVEAGEDWPIECLTGYPPLPGSGS